jgi:hypothetical protein
MAAVKIRAAAVKAWGFDPDSLPTPKTEEERREQRELLNMHRRAQDAKARHDEQVQYKARAEQQAKAIALEKEFKQKEKKLGEALIQESKMRQRDQLVKVRTAVKKRQAEVKAKRIGQVEKNFLMLRAKDTQELTRWTRAMKQGLDQREIEGVLEKESTSLGLTDCWQEWYFQIVDGELLTYKDKSKATLLGKISLNKVDFAANIVTRTLNVFERVEGVKVDPAVVAAKKRKHDQVKLHEMRRAQQNLKESQKKQRQDMIKHKQDTRWTAGVKRRKKQLEHQTSQKLKEQNLAITRLHEKMKMEDEEKKTEEKRRFAAGFSFEERRQQEEKEKQFAGESEEARRKRKAANFLRKDTDRDRGWATKPNGEKVKVDNDGGVSPYTTPFTDEATLKRQADDVKRRTLAKKKREEAEKKYAAAAKQRLEEARAAKTVSDKRIREEEAIKLAEGEAQDKLVAATREREENSSERATRKKEKQEYEAKAKKKAKEQEEKAAEAMAKKKTEEKEAERKTEEKEAEKKRASKEVKEQEKKNTKPAEAVVVWSDPKFPCSNASIGSTGKQWRRAVDLGMNELFAERPGGRAHDPDPLQVDPSDIMQGELGDCW